MKNEFKTLKDLNEYLTIQYEKREELKRKKELEELEKTQALQTFLEKSDHKVEKDIRMYRGKESVVIVYKIKMDYEIPMHIFEDYVGTYVNWQFTSMVDQRKYTTALKVLSIEKVNDLLEVVCEFK